MDLTACDLAALPNDDLDKLLGTALAIRNLRSRLIRLPREIRDHIYRQVVADFIEDKLESQTFFKQLSAPPLFLASKQLAEECFERYPRLPLTITMHSFEKKCFEACDKGYAATLRYEASQLNKQIHISPAQAHEAAAEEFATKIGPERVKGVVTFSKELALSPRCWWKVMVPEMGFWQARFGH